VLCIISVSLLCLDYLAKCLANQAVSNDSLVEESVSTKTSCMRVTFKQSNSYELF